MISGISGALLRCLASPDLEVVTYAAGLCLNLSNEHMWCQLLLEQGGADRFEAMVAHDDPLIARYAASTLVNMSARIPGLELIPTVECDIKKYGDLVKAVELGLVPSDSVENWRPAANVVAAIAARASPRGKKEMQAAAALSRVRKEAEMAAFKAEQERQVADRRRAEEEEAAYLLRLEAEAKREAQLAERERQRLVAEAKKQAEDEAAAATKMQAITRGRSDRELTKGIKAKRAAEQAEAERKQLEAEAKKRAAEEVKRRAALEEEERIQLEAAEKEAQLAREREEAEA